MKKKILSTAILLMVLIWGLAIVCGSGDVTFSGPADGVITQTFKSGHDGTDIGFGGENGKPVYCANGGTVEYAGWENPSDHSQGFGLEIRIRDGQGNKYWYGHLQENSFKVKTGDTVNTGDYIANEDNTGHSTGPHLHFRIHDSSGTALDPFPGLKVGDKVVKGQLYTAKPPSSNISGVGGVVIPVDKFALLAPHIGLASTILVATVSTVIYVKRVSIERRNNEHEK